MASSTSSLMSILTITALALTLTCPHATSACREISHDDDINDPDLHDLCEQTRKPKLCREIMRSDMGRFEDKDRRSVAKATIDLARAKADEIHGNLISHYNESRNEELKEKYVSCSKNYKDIMSDLEVARDDLVSREYLRSYHVQVGDALEELKNCERQFEKPAFDPAHIGDRNREFGVYLDMVKVSTDRLDGDYVLSDRTDSGHAAI